MITKDEAERIALEFLHKKETNSSIPMYLVKEATIERDFGWVFHYNSRAYLETRELRHHLAGNSPFIVDRRDGSIHVTGTAKPVEFYISEYEKVRKHD